jgi:hypothetical protein
MKPIELTHSDVLGYDQVDRLKDKPGLYFFSCRFGKGAYEPFYIGKSLKISLRLDQYVSSKGKHEKRIRKVVLGGHDVYSGIQLGIGPRFFHFGYVNPSKGLNMDKAIGYAERALIQYARIVGWKIINNHYAGPAAFRSFDVNGSKYNRLLPNKLISHK